MFEVELRNTFSSVQNGTLAFNFPGTDSREVKREVTRSEIHEPLMVFLYLRLEV